MLNSPIRTTHLPIIDIFPLFDAAYSSSASLYYIDDVSYEYQPYSLKNIDAGVLNLNVKNRFLAGEASVGTVQIRNLGKTAITSVDLTCKVDNGTPFNVSASPINVASLALNEIAIGPITYKKGTSTVSCSILKVNGNPDDDATNNDKDLNIVGIEAAPNKVMFTEEATGTWCQFCPRGAVYMDSMAKTYPKHWAGVAVHNADPMTVPAYDKWIATFPGFSGYPSIINDRNQLTDPLTVESDFYDHIVIPTPVILTNGAKYNSSTRELEVSVKGDFLEDLSGDYRFNLVVIENNVKFPGTGYRQVNAYAANARGWMGGFEKLPNPVPANRMTYNHVARAIFDDAVGLEGYLPSTIKKGSNYYITYSLTLADTFKVENIELIGLLYGPSGEVVNASITTVDEAVKNGLYSSTSNPTTVFKAPKVSPNPSDVITYLTLDLPKSTEVSIEILDLTGRIITTKNYGSQIGSISLPINTLGFENGSYLVKLNVDHSVRTSKLIVNH